MAVSLEHLLSKRYSKYCHELVLKIFILIVGSLSFEHSGTIRLLDNNVFWFLQLF